MWYEKIGDFIFRPYLPALTVGKMLMLVQVSRVGFGGLWSGQAAGDLMWVQLVGKKLC